MKKLIYPLFVTLSLASCQKGKQITPAAAVGGIVLNQSPVTNSGSTGLMPAFTSQDSITVFGLMNSNNLSTKGFVFYYYQTNNAFPQYTLAGVNQLATAKQVRNGLPIFFEDFSFDFEAGKFVGPPPSAPYTPGNITLDNKPNLSLQTVRAAFIKADNAEEAYNISIQDSTLVAQLGYYNLNVNELPSGVAPSYIKAWYVHPLHSSWPLGYFRDDTGDMIIYSPITGSGPAAP